MQHIYTVSPVECQPQNDNVPPAQPKHRGWLLAIGLVVLGFVVSVYAAWLLGGGS